MNVRLPIAGAVDTQRLVPGEIQPLADRLVAPMQLVSVVSARSRAAKEVDFARVMVEEIVGAGVRCAALVARMAVEEGFELDEDPRPDGDLGRIRAAGADLAIAVRTHPSTSAVAVASGLGKAHERGAKIVVTVGSPVPAMYRTRLCVMITGGLSLPLWDLSARALRDRIDLEVADAREGVARKLAAEIARQAT